MPPQSPTMAEVLEYALDSRLGGVYTAMPGEVRSYDAATQTASVQPLVKQAYYDEAEQRQVESLPIVQGVPVCFPGAGAYHITFPINIGDSVLLVFANCSVDRWLALGGQVDPADDRRHTLSDAIAIPGLRARPQKISGVPSNALVVTGALVLLGGADATDPVVRRSDLATVVSDLQAHKHSGVTTGSGISGVLDPSTTITTPACSPVTRTK